MAAKTNLWFIRLPDGRVLRARSANVLRRHLKSGRIPWDSRFRHSTKEPWQRLDNADEFTDLMPRDDSDAPTAELPRPDAMPRRSPVRTMVDEMLTACDSSLQRAKLITAGCTGIGIGIIVALAAGAGHLIHEWTWLLYGGAAAVALILFATCSSVLTHMTALELSRFRRARFSEIRSGLIGSIARLTVALGLISGVIVGLIVALRWLPGWLAAGEDMALTETGLTIVNGVRVILEVACWSLLGLALLLVPPILLVEENSIPGSLRDWFTLLWRHVGRIYLYQAFAFAFAAILAIPLVLSLLMTTFLTDMPYAFVPSCLLGGIALTPVLAYLPVAQVFIYLNLRYEFFYTSRQR